MLPGPRKDNCSRRGRQGDGWPDSIKRETDLLSLDCSEDKNGGRRNRRSCRGVGGWEGVVGKERGSPQGRKRCGTFRARRNASAEDVSLAGHE